MSAYLVGFFVSAAISVGFLVLFAHEERTGRRRLASLRSRFDIFIIEASRACGKFFSLLGKDSLRQIFHFALHKVLQFALYINKRWETTVRHMMHTNKTLAQGAELERTTRNKLEEIALHKMKHSLSDDEKKKRKDAVLKG